MNDTEEIRSTFSCFKYCRKKKNVVRWKEIETFLTAAGLVGVIRAVVDAVTLGVHLVDTFFVLTLEAEVRADARSYSGGGDRFPKSKHIAYFNQSVRALLSLTSNIPCNQRGFKVRLECTMHSD